MSGVQTLAVFLSQRPSLLSVLGCESKYSWYWLWGEFCHSECIVIATYLHLVKFSWYSSFLEIRFALLEMPRLMVWCVFCWNMFMLFDLQISRFKQTLVTYDCHQQSTLLLASHSVSIQWSSHVNQPIAFSYIIGYFLLLPTNSLSCLILSELIDNFLN